MSFEKKLQDAVAKSTGKAWDALARYKFLMFGYHAAAVVRDRRALGLKGGNPFRELVEFARRKLSGAEQWTGCRVRGKPDWADGGWEGVALGEPVECGQRWLPVLKDGEDDPDWYKLAGVSRLP